jgi:group I intron endonuclease
MLAFKNWYAYVKDILSAKRDLIKSQTLNKPGVYLWHNKITDKCYVGSSINLYKRVSRYFQLGYLNYVTHKNLPIVRAICKYKMENFTLVILDYTSTNLNKSEQYFIDLLNPAYNVMKIVGSRNKKKQMCSKLITSSAEILSKRSGTS